MRSKSDGTHHFDRNGTEFRGIYGIPTERFSGPFFGKSRLSSRRNRSEHDRNQSERALKSTMPTRYDSPPSTDLGRCVTRYCISRCAHTHFQHVPSREDVQYSTSGARSAPFWSVHRNGTERNGTERNGTERNGTERARENSPVPFKALRSRVRLSGYTSQWLPAPPRSFVTEEARNRRVTLFGGVRSSSLEGQNPGNNPRDKFCSFI